MKTLKNFNERCLADARNPKFETNTNDSGDGSQKLQESDFDGMA